MDRNINGKNQMEENQDKIGDFSKKKKSEKFDISPIFRRLLLHVPGSASGEENVADLSTIN